MMERKFARYFHEQVKELIQNEAEREKVFESLRKYQSSQELNHLLQELRTVLNEPSYLELYEHIRPLVLPKHQVEYSEKTPQIPGIKLRVIRLRRRHGSDLGFAVRGGLEHGVGVFISAVKRGSQADKVGLRVGDEIVRVNGFTIAEALHDDVLNLIKSRDEIILKVTHIGMIPKKDNTTQTVSWKYVEDLDSAKALQEILDNDTQPADKRASQGSLCPEIKIFINTTGVSSIGCGIVSGPYHFPGIFVEKIRPGGLAEEVGLEVGDQIIEVNATSFIGITHNEAVIALKSSTQLNMLLKKKVGLPLFQQARSRPGRSEPAATFKPSVVSEDPTPAPVPSLQPRYRTILETNRSVSQSDDNKRSTYLLNNEGDDQAIGTGAHLATVMAESLQPAQHTDEDNVLDIVDSITGLASEDVTSSLFGGQRDHGGRSVLHQLPLGGSAAILAARNARHNPPTLLGSYQQVVHSDVTHVTDLYSLFPSEVVENKELAQVTLTLDENESLGIGVDGGIGTPLADKILISDLYGAADRHGELEKGDQILMVNGHSVLDLSADQARNILQEAESGTVGTVKMIVAKGGLLNDEDAVTYF